MYVDIVEEIKKQSIEVPPWLLARGTLRSEVGEICFSLRPLAVYITKHIHYLFIKNGKKLIKIECEKQPPNKVSLNILAFTPFSLQL